jgi:ubiquinone/menaquinone biosynthesis C-methylase UbiE
VNTLSNNSSESILEYTGERYTPEERGKIELEHFHRYIFTSNIVKEKQVLDIACGEGYGSNILADFASHVIGVDISDEAILHAKHKYKKSNLEFKQGSCDEIPLVDSSIDTVVSFETIEHHDKHEAMLKEIKRVLKPGGILIISSPEKHEYTDIVGSNNPHHVKELYRQEFEDLIISYFHNVAFLGQRVVYGSAILREDGPSFTYTSNWPDNALTQTPGMQRPLYLIAVASDSEIPLLSSSILEQPDNQIEITISYLNSQIIKRDIQIKSLLVSLSWRITKPLRVLERIIQEGELRQEHKARILGLAQSIYKKLHLP